MTTQQEALRMAIEAMENADELPPIKYGMRCIKAIEACQSALAEQDDEAVACLTCPNNRDVVCAYCEGSGLAKVETGELLPCPQGCDIPEHANVLSVIDKQLYGRYVHTVVSDAKYPPGTKLYPVEQKQYTESDIDEAIGAVDWANTSWQQASVEAKKLVMRFVGSQVPMEPKWICVKDRLPELGIPVLCKVGAKQHPIRVMFLTKKEWEINNNTPWESLSGSNCYSHFVMTQDFGLRIMSCLF